MHSLLVFSGFIFRTMEPGVANPALYAAGIGDLRPAKPDHHGGGVVRRDLQRCPDGRIVLRKRDYYCTKAAGCTKQFKIGGGSHLIVRGILLSRRRVGDQKTWSIAEEAALLRIQVVQDPGHLICAINESELYGLPVSVIWRIGQKVDEKTGHGGVHFPVEDPSVRAPGHDQRIQNIGGIIPRDRFAAVFQIAVEDLDRASRTDRQTVLATPAGILLIRCVSAAMIFVIKIQQMSRTYLDAATASDAQMIIHFKFCNIDHSLKTGSAFSALPVHLIIQQ